MDKKSVTLRKENIKKKNGWLVRKIAQTPYTRQKDEKNVPEWKTEIERLNSLVTKMTKDIESLRSCQSPATTIGAGKKGYRKIRSSRKVNQNLCTIDWR